MEGNCCLNLHCSRGQEPLRARSAGSTGGCLGGVTDKPAKMQRGLSPRTRASGSLASEMRVVSRGAMSMGSCLWGSHRSSPSPTRGCLMLAKWRQFSGFHCSHPQRCAGTVESNALPGLTAYEGLERNFVWCQLRSAPLPPGNTSAKRGFTSRSYSLDSPSLRPCWALPIQESG